MVPSIYFGNDVPCTFLDVKLGKKKGEKQVWIQTSDQPSVHYQHMHLLDCVCIYVSFFYSLSCLPPLLLLLLQLPCEPAFFLCLTGDSGSVSVSVLTVMFICFFALLFRLQNPDRWNCRARAGKGETLVFFWFYFYDFPDGNAFSCQYLLFWECSSVHWHSGLGSTVKKAGCVWQLELECGGISQKNPTKVCI